MGRKVFISMLGTGFYKQCKYEKDEFCSTENRFIQVATIERLTQLDNWGDNDCMFFLLTKKARTENWEATGNHFKTDNTYIGLKEELASMQLQCKICDVDIPEGNDENEMWDIFNKLYSVIEEGDELYIDITHSFRYLPMMLLVFCNYVSHMKNTSIASITYGNYETKNNNNSSNGIINDLMPLALLQNYTLAAATFEKFGQIEILSNILPIQRNKTTKKERREQEELITLKKFINNFQLEIATCRGAKIVNGESAIKINNTINKVRSHNIPEPIKPILTKLQDCINQYQSESLSNLDLAINWCQKYKLIQQGYTLVQESIITKLCDNLFPDLKTSLHTSKKGKEDKEYRDFFSSLLALDENDRIRPCTWRGILSNNRDIANCFYAEQWVLDLRQQYISLTQLRNSINHAGFISKQTPSEFINNMPIKGKACFDILNNITPKDINRIIANIKSIANKPSLFINLSNHPIATWSEKQLEAAKSYGKIEEMRFPNIDSNADNAAIKDIATDYVEKILELNKQYDVTVHVMGEMVFTYLIVNMLKGQGIRCIASTSERCVTERADGVKENIFNFTRFRDY